jgi:hypothetical protein
MKTSIPICRSRSAIRIIQTRRSRCATSQRTRPASRIGRRCTGTRTISAAALRSRWANS